MSSALPAGCGFSYEVVLVHLSIMLSGGSYPWEKRPSFKPQTDEGRRRGRKHGSRRLVSFLSMREAENKLLSLPNGLSQDLRLAHRTKRGCKLC